MNTLQFIRPITACAVVALLVPVMFGAAPALAQQARSGGNANAQVMMQMQQLASERTALQAETARLKKELEDVKKDRDALKKKSEVGDSRAKASAAAVAASAAQRDAADKQLKATKDKMDQLIAKFRETAQTLREVETERASAKQALAIRDQEIKVCIDRNLALYKVNEETLDRLSKQSPWSRMAAAEPFTRIKRAQLDNLIDEYRYRAEDQRVTPESLHTAGRAAAARAAAGAAAAPAPASPPQGGPGTAPSAAPASNPAPTPAPASGPPPPAPTAAPPDAPTSAPPQSTTPPPPSASPPR